MIEKLMITTLLLYYRLIMYPLIAYSLVVEGLSIKDCDHDQKKSDKLYIYIAFFFVVLWCSSAIALITRDNNTVTTFNTYVLLPTGTLILFYTWLRILRRCHKIKQNLKEQKEMQHE